MFAGTSRQIKNMQHLVVHSVCSVIVSINAFSSVKQNTLFKQTNNTHSILAEKQLQEFAFKLN